MRGPALGGITLHVATTSNMVSGGGGGGRRGGGRRGGGDRPVDAHIAQQQQRDARQRARSRRHNVGDGQSRRHYAAQMPRHLGRDLALLPEPSDLPTSARTQMAEVRPCVPVATAMSNLPRWSLSATTKLGAAHTARIFSVLHGSMIEPALKADVAAAERLRLSPSFFGRALVVDGKVHARNPDVNSMIPRDPIGRDGRIDEHCGSFESMVNPWWAV
jgi:hypothetical protein